MPTVMGPFLEQCRLNGVALSRTKIDCGESMSYTGLDIDRQLGCKLSKQHYQALMDLLLQPPETLKDLQSSFRISELP